MNPFSERFANALRVRLPDFAARLHSEGDYLVAEVPAPSGRATLRVSTDGDEVTVGFGDLWHAHFEEQEDLDLVGESYRDAPFERVIHFLGEFLSGRVVIQHCFKDGRYVNSGPVHRWYYQTLCSCGTECDRCEWLSWAGHHDLGPLPARPNEVREMYQDMTGGGESTDSNNSMQPGARTSRR
jgi:hypothetical protein